MRHAFIFLFFLLHWSVRAVDAQEAGKVSGRVVDRESSLPVPSALIVSKVRGSGVETDANGGFTLYYAATDTIQITHPGYKTLSLRVDGNSVPPGVIRLERAVKELETVIVSSGIDQIPKERATGSYNFLDNAILSEQVSTGILERLEAIGNGFSVARRNNVTAPRYMIRGLSTINGPGEPLIVLDNFPFEGDINNINPNDIESITILKDAAAASIWGSKAGNGVIVITTKKGRLNQPIEIDLNSNIRIADKPDLFRQPRISSSELIDVEMFLFSKGYRFADTASADRYPFTPVYEILFDERNGKITEQERNALLDELRRNDVRKEYSKYFYEKGFNRQYSINVRGGSKDVAWVMSGGYDDNKDVLDAIYKRFSFRNDTRISVSKKIRISAGVSLVSSVSKDGKPRFGEFQNRRGQLPSYTSFLDENGNPVPFAKDYRTRFVDTAGGGNILDWNYYPLTDHNHREAKSKQFAVIGNIGLDVSFTKWLRGELKYQINRQQTNNESIYGRESYYVRDQINQFYQPGSATPFPIPQGEIRDYSNSVGLHQNFRAQLNFDRKNEDHQFVGILGFETRESKSTSQGFRLYGYLPENGSFARVDKFTRFTSFVHGRQLTIGDYTSHSWQLIRFVSMYGNAAYTFRNRYTLSASVRRDASNLFGIRTNDRWTPLWSAGLSWDITKERFFNVPKISSLRFRATYGYSGNVNPALSALTTISYSVAGINLNKPNASIINFFNPELRWEKSRQINLGFDFAMFDSRLFGSMEHYWKKGTDLYGPDLVDYTVGIRTSSITKNVASMVARGFDIELNSVNIRNGFEWRTSLNLSTYRDEVTKYYLSSRQGNRYVGNGVSVSGIPGKPVNAVFSYAWAGLDPATGDPLGYDASKQVTKNYSVLTGSTIDINDLVYHGPALPQVFGSLGNTFSWNGISLSVRLTYKFGHYYRRSSINYTSLFSSLEGHSDWRLRWQSPGDEAHTNVPSMTYPLVSNRESFYSNSEVLVEKADIVRLQYVTLTYNLKQKMMARLPIRQCQVYLNADNLGLIWRANKHNIDTDYTNTAILFGKNISIGARVGF